MGNGEFWHSEMLMHHGILGMKWGVRRYQNKDGTLTELGKKRYLSEDGKGLSEEGRKKFLTTDGRYTRAAREEYGGSYLQKAVKDAIKTESRRIRDDFFYKDVSTEKERKFREAMDAWSEPYVSREKFDKIALPLLKKITDKYYNWYEGEVHHPAIKALIGDDAMGLYVDRTYGKGKDKAKVQQVATVILKDMDIPVTDKNIAMINELIYYD